MKKLISKLSKKQKIIILAIGLVIIAALSVGIIILNSKTEEVKVAEKKKKEKTPDAEKIIQVVDIHSKTRPYAIMINNINIARTIQSGMSDAYLVYEIIVEGGITRYLALFKDTNVERIGSIRSARHYFLDYVLENDAIYVHHGQSDQAAADFGPLGIDRIVADNSKTGWRDTSLKVSSEHTLFTRTQLLNNAVESRNIRSTTDSGLLLDYSADPLVLSNYGNESNATFVTLTYSNAIKNTYQYDEETKLYNRFVNGEAQIDKANGNQLTYKNIIAYQVNNYNLNDGSGKGRQGLDNIGSGTGYFISEGKAVKINWSKSSRGTKTEYTFENGEKLKVNDGKTFIQIVPNSGSIAIE